MPLKVFDESVAAAATTLQTLQAIQSEIAEALKANDFRDYPISLNENRDEVVAEITDPELKAFATVILKHIDALPKFEGLSSQEKEKAMWMMELLRAVQACFLEEVRTAYKLDADENIGIRAGWKLVRKRERPRILVVGGGPLDSSPFMAFLNSLGAEDCGDPNCRAHDHLRSQA